MVGEHSQQAEEGVGSSVCQSQRMCRPAELVVTSAVMHQQVGWGRQEELEARVITTTESLRTGHLVEFGVLMFDQQAIETSLQIVGIAVQDYSWPSPALPASAAWMFAACLPEDGRVERTFDLGETDLIEKANSAWWELVVEYGLLDQDRSFLVSVGPVDEEIPARPHWSRVRLERDWDILGGGANNGVLGGPSGRPGFVMLSLDETILIGGTTWYDSIGIIALPNPLDASAIRKFMHRP